MQKTIMAFILMILMIFGIISFGPGVPETGTTESGAEYAAAVETAPATAEPATMATAAVTAEPTAMATAPATAAPPTNATDVPPINTIAGPLTTVATTAPNLTIGPIHTVPWPITTTTAPFYTIGPISTKPINTLLPPLTTKPNITFKFP